MAVVGMGVGQMPDPKTTQVRPVFHSSPPGNLGKQTNKKLTICFVLLVCLFVCLLFFFCTPNSGPSKRPPKKKIPGATTAMRDKYVHCEAFLY